MGQFKIITQNVSTVLFEIMPVRHSDKMTAHASLLARDLATEEAMTRCGDCDIRQSPRSGYKIADIWHVRYRRFNSPAFAKSARSRDFLAFLLWESAVKLTNQVGRYYHMIFQNGGRHRKLFLNRRKRGKFDHTVVRKAMLIWCNVERLR